MVTGDLSPAYGLANPPFGVGHGRSLSHYVSGFTQNATPYQAFRYTSSTYDAYGLVGTMRLAWSLPPLFVSLPENPRPGIVGQRIPNSAGLLVVSEHPAYAQAVLDAALPAITAFARLRPLDLAVDHQSLTVQQVPGADGLTPYMEDLAIVAGSINRERGLSGFAVPAPVGVGWYGFPGYQYVARDDRVLGAAPVVRHGTDDEALDLVVSPPGAALPALGFAHRYLTTSGSGSDTTTHTNHEYLVGLTLPVSFGRISMDWRGFAAPVMFFHPSFDQQHTIQCDDSEFAADVARPMLDFLTEMNPPPWCVYGTTMWFRPETPVGPEAVDWTIRFAAEFFARVSDRVWSRLGVPGNPFRPAWV